VGDRRPVARPDGLRDQRVERHQDSLSERQRAVQVERAERRGGQRRRRDVADHHRVDDAHQHQPHLHAGHGKGEGERRAQLGAPRARRRGRGGEDVGGGGGSDGHGEP
jgi:hypothetical protein